LLATKQLDPIDFREMKTEYTNKLEKLEARLAIRDQGHEDVPALLDAGIDNLLKLDYIYADGDIERKRTVISSMYPEKLTFDGDRLRTNRVNEAARIIYTLDQGLGQNKKGQSGNIPALSSQVDLAGRISNHFWIGLRLLQSL
jgi:site-specific DNA recombinase